MNSEQPIGILGSGVVAKALALGFQKNGHPVFMGTRDPKKLSDFANESRVLVGSMAEAGKFGSTLVLAVHGKGASEAISYISLENRKNKVMIDATNPISEEKPDQGVIRYFTNANESLMELLQSTYPEIKFVKAFNSVGSSLMVEPKFAEGKPTMFICGNDTEAKESVSQILKKFGWIPRDMGFAPSARPIEALAQLWCAPGFLQNQWGHAFSMFG